MDTIERTDFYVYIFISESDNITIRYVGKGSGNRIYDNNSRKYKVRDENRIKVAEGLTEQEAFMYERFLIALYGRIDLGTGTLTNHTDGGEGMAGASPEWRREHSSRMTGEGNSFFGKTHTQETKDKIIARRQANQWKKKFIPLTPKQVEILYRQIMSRRTKRKNAEKREYERRKKQRIQKNKGLHHVRQYRKHTEEFKQMVSENNRTRVLKPNNKYFAAYGHSRDRWEVIGPNGEWLCVLCKNLWCDKMNLNRESMVLVARGKQKAGHHKGWRCRSVKS